MMTVEKDPLGRCVDLYYEDIGYGQPVVFVHGWPFDHGMWENQRFALVNSGYRVITYDQRGFGLSSKPANGYHYDKLTDDLRTLLDFLDLNDVVLVGFSMGAAEIVHYMSRNFGQRIRQVVLISSVTPKFPDIDYLKTGAQDLIKSAPPDRDEMMRSIAQRIFAGPASSPANEMVMEWATGLLDFLASPIALSDTASAMRETDLTNAMKSIKHVPTLLVHGTQDRVAPFQANAVQSSKMLPDCSFKPYEDAPHGLFATHAERLNMDLLAFIKTPPMTVLP